VDGLTKCPQSAAWGSCWLYNWFTTEGGAG